MPGIPLSPLATSPLVEEGLARERAYHRVFAQDAAICTLGSLSRKTRSS